MRPLKKTLDFDLNENGTNTYCFYDNFLHKYVLQLSWQTSRPNAHFIKTLEPITPQLFNYYPVENRYDWYYDYKVDDVVLHQTKYHTVPKAIRPLCDNHISFRSYHHLVHTRIGKRNSKIMLLLHKICNFKISLSPTDRLLDFDASALSEVLRYIEVHARAKALGHDYRRKSIYTFNTFGENVLMRLIGCGYSLLFLMRKFKEARNEHARNQGYYVSSNW